jgi:hypothetical protein
MVRDEATNREAATVTDVNGVFTIAALNDGIYRVEAMVPGFIPATMEHLELKAGQVIHASVALRPNNVERITVGALAPMITPDASTTTISSELLRKLPF